ncbi:transporter substrate-binding domain-containing protein [Oceanospirillum sediminis]|nr:transporter substrate-binding domain-containing protein [Oceanospirillum sediminis]
MAHTTDDQAETQTLMPDWLYSATPHIISLIAVLSLLLSSINAFGDETQKTVVIGGDYNYPPYEFINDQGEPAGYNVDLTRAIAEVMGMKVSFRMGEWSQIRKAFEQGQIDALQGMIRSEERSRIFDFSPAHAIIHQSVFARRGAQRISLLQQLAGKEVVVQENGIMHDYLISNKTGARLITVPTHADALRRLASGKHDYALVANLPGLYVGKELGLSNIIPVGRTFQAQRYGYAVRKGNDALLAQFSEGLAILKNTGRQQQIYNKWLSPLQEHTSDWKNLGKVAAIVSALLLVVLGGTVVWNRMLKKEVDRRSEELNIRQQQLIQADKMTSLGILVSGVAHEINNPAGLLLLNIPMVRDAWQDCEDILEQHYQQHGDFLLAGLPYSRMRDEIPLLLSDMQDSSRRIKRIVEDLKDFARQRHDDEHAPFDLNEVTEMAIRLVDNSIRKSTDHFSVEYYQPMPAVAGNAQRIEQVIINLILNACQALGHRQQAVSIRTFYDAGSGQVGLEVIDQGCGIDSENLKRLIDPFFTTKREQGGTGLGLSVSSGIVQAHNGQMQFSSEPGEGTRVTLTFPASTTAQTTDSYSMHSESQVNHS